MLRKLVPIVASLPMLACSATLQRPVVTTEAATGLEQVTRSAAGEIDPAVSPDGKSIAYEVTGGAGVAPHVEVISLDGVGTGAPPRIEYSSKAAGSQPAWMPDGSSLVFVSSADGAGNLVQSSVPTLGRTVPTTNLLAPVGTPNTVAFWPALSPDGRMVLASLPRVEEFDSGWSSVRRFDAALGVSDLQGTGITLLGAGTDPAWSPDGKRLAFARRVQGHSHLFVSDAAGLHAVQITDGPDDDELPAWSPDGRRIAFCSVQSAEHGAAQANIFAVAADGSGLVQLTEGDRFACRPDWARDGFIYFHADVAGRFHIWRIRPSGSWIDAG
jgi:Tol biopolymer transport system component